MICIGFGASDSVRSKLIRWATKSDWSHVWVEYQSRAWGGYWAAHSTEKGVVKEPAARVKRRYNRAVLFEAKFDLTPGMSSARTLVGKPYDFMVIWNALLLILSRWIRYGWLVQYVSRDLSKVTCSEFVATIIKRSGLQEAKGLDPELTTPGDLHRLCERSREFRIL